MLHQLRPAIALLLLMTAITGIAYPLVVTGIAQVAFQEKADGSLIERDDQVVGSELIGQSFVDPDNRRAVDYACRRRTLDDATPVAELLEHWRDGRLKQALIARVLDCRQAHAELFRRGAYLPLTVQGRHADKVIAFARLGEGERAVIIAPRLASTLLAGAPTPLIPAQNWDDTRVNLPFALSPAYSTGLFPSAAVSSSKELMLSAVLAEFPVNLLIQQS